MKTTPTWWTSTRAALADHTAPARVVGTVTVLLGVAGAALATRAWDRSATTPFLWWSALALLATGVALLVVAPGRLRWRALAVLVVVALVAGTVGWRGVASPRRDVAAAYDGTGVRWSQDLPAEWREGEGSEDVVFATLVSPERVVLTHDDDVLVLDARTGDTVASFVSSRATTYGLAVGRTVDGFVVQDGDSYDFYDTDGEPLGETVSGDQLVARVPGTTVVLDCSDGCAAVGIDDEGQTVWTHRGYQLGGTVPIADDLPTYAGDVLDVVPAHALLAWDVDRTRAADRRLDERDPATGRLVRTIGTEVAGSSLELDGSATTFAVVPQGAAEDDQCVVRTWPEGAGSDPIDSEPDDCAYPLAAVGHRLLTGADATYAYDLDRPDDDPQRLWPEVDDGSDEQPYVVHDAGPGGFALRGIAVREQPLLSTERDPRAVTGGRWGTPWSERWVHRRAGTITSGDVGEDSVLITADVVPLNPWDRPGKDEREVVVLRVADGRQTGAVRVRDQLDSVVLLPGGSALVVVDRRVVLVGGEA